MSRQDVTVELFYGGVWNRIPVYTRNPITITRSADGTPASASLAIDDRASIHNPRNPMSPLYGLAGQNTPIRIAFPGDIRMAGEVARYAPDRTEDFVAGGDRGDAWVEIEANGVLRRIGQGTDPRSALRRTLAGSAPVAYWPMEDGVDANRAASGIPGGAQMVIRAGIIDFEGEGGPAGSDGFAHVVEEAASVLSATVPDYADTGAWQASLWVKATQTFAGGTPGASYDALVVMGLDTTDGCRFVFVISNGFGGLGTSPAFVDVYNSAGTFVGGVIDPSTAELPAMMGGDWHCIQVRVTQVGATIDLSLWIDGQLVDTQSGIVCSGLPRTVRVLDQVDFVEAADVGVAHIAVHGYSAFVAQWDAGIGHVGERAADRIERLCDERGVGFTLIGDAADTQVMGVQFPDTTTNLFDETQLTDSGMLFDSRDDRGLTYRTGRSLYAQPASLALDWAAFQIAPPFKGVIDDRLTRNDVTVNRREGSSARAVQETGPMNVQDPSDDPQGVGRVVGTVDINPSADTALPDHAGWHLHFGTVDEIRFAQVTVKDLDDQPGLVVAAAAIDIGDLITVANLPADVSPDLARLIVTGYSEVIEAAGRRITFNCTPASPYDIGTWDEAVAVTSTRWDSATTIRPGVTPIDSTQTSITLDTPTGPLWTMNPAHFPRDVEVGGERMRVTAIAPDTGTRQIFTVLRSINGVVKSHPAGVAVRLWKTARYGL